MNTRLVPILILLCLVPIPAFALEVQLDNTDYLRNQTVTVTGTVTPSNSTDPMHIFILQKNIWYDHVALPITEETFSHTFEITDAWENDGTYTISVQYNGEETRIPFTVTTPLTAEQIQLNQIIEEMIDLENTQSNSTTPEIDNSTQTNSTEVITEEPIIEEPISEEIIDEIVEEVIPTNQTSIINDTQSNSTESIPEIAQATTEIPGWIKGVFVFWSNDQITDGELLEAIRFLVNSGILVL